MQFDPATGAEKPYPSHAQQWRLYHGADAWLFNPWSGARRLAGDVGTDLFGLLVLPPGEPLYAQGESAAMSLATAVGCHVTPDYPKCTKKLQAQGVAYPRTCAECGLGPCLA